MSMEKPKPLQKPPGYKNRTIPTHLPPPPQANAGKIAAALHSKNTRNSCCCCFSLTIVLLMTLLISAGATFYAWYQPRLPKIHLKSINLSEFEIYDTEDGQELDAETTLGIEIKNPSRGVRLEYGRTRVSLTAINGDVFLGRQLMDGFEQVENNVTTLKIAMKVKSEILDEESAVELKNGYRCKNLAVNVEVKTGIRWRGSRWKTGIIPAVVICNGVRLYRRVQNCGVTPECRFVLVNW